MPFAPVSLTFYTSAQRVTRRSLRKLLLLSDLVTFDVGEVKSYTSYPAVNADIEVDAVTKAQAALYFAQPARPAGLKIGKFDYDGAPDPIATVLSALLTANPDWFGLIAGGTLASAVTAANIQAIAAWAEANKRLYSALTCDAAVKDSTAGNIAEVLKGLNYRYTALSFAEANTPKLDLAVATRGLSFDPDKHAASWAFMNPLVGVAAISGLTPTQEEHLADQNVNRLDTDDGVTCWGMSGVTVDGRSLKSLISTEWFGRNLQGDLTQAQLSAAANGGRGIPYNQNGLDAVEGIIANRLARGVALEHFCGLAEEKADPTGTIKAPVVDVPSLGDISQANRDAKRLPFTCAMNGSGEVINIDGEVFFDAV